MDLLKSKIAETIFLPDFLHDYQDELKDEIIACNWEILDTYYKGVKDEFISNTSVRKWCRKIDNLSYDLLQIAPPHIHLQSWLWIGETIEMWIDFAVLEEQYEVATNLRKLLNSEYA